MGYICEILLLLLCEIYYSIENHFKVFTGAGFTTAKTYRYWDPSSRGIDFAGKLV